MSGFSAAKDKSENNRKSNVNVSPPAMSELIRNNEKEGKKTIIERRKLQSYEISKLSIFLEYQLHSFSILILMIMRIKVRVWK